MNLRSGRTVIIASVFRSVKRPGIESVRVPARAVIMRPVRAAGMRNLRMVVSYVGTRFAGWQVQPGRATVQGILEERISRMLQEPVRIAGAGRTDAGVHARGQVANVFVSSRIPVPGLLRGLNARLPPDIALMHAEEAPAALK